MSGFWESLKNLFVFKRKEKTDEKKRIEKQRNRLETVLDFLEDSIRNDFKDLDKGIFLLRKILDNEYKHLLELGKLQNSPYLTNNILLSIGECMQNERYDDNHIINQLRLMTEKEGMFANYSIKSGLINKKIKLQIFGLCEKIEDKKILKKNAKKLRIGMTDADRIAADANVLVKYFEFDIKNGQSGSSDFTENEKNQIMNLIDNIIDKANSLKKTLNSKREKK